MITLAQLNMSGHYRLKHVVPHGEDYIVEQLHVHWSHADDDHYGSEHLLDGKSYPFEVDHFVFDRQIS